MKKVRISLITFSLVLPALFSCNPSGKNPTFIPIAQKYDSSLSLKEHFVSLEYGLFESFIDTEKTFVVLVQGDEDDCICYFNFLENLTSYMKSNSARIYHIKLNDLNEAHGIKAQTNANTIAVFKKGQLVSQYVFKDSDQLIGDQEAFNKKMDSLVSWSDVCFVLDKSQLDSLYSSDIVGFSILYFRESCSDCRYMFSAFFDDYVGNLSSSLYLFNLDEIKSQGSEIYQTFKDDYGLSSKYSEYGYGDGVVPTFQYVTPVKDYKPAEMVKDAAVYLNDSLSQDGEDYKVTTTYWDDTRVHEFLYNVNLPSNLSGLKVQKDDVLNGYWKKEKANAYHQPLIEEFLKFYVGVNE